VASDSKLHPAEHRAYRELYVSGRQLTSRWSELGDRLGDTDARATLQNGALRVRELLAALEPCTAARGVHGGPAVRGVGVGTAAVRTGIVDRTLDAGAALRFAVLDMDHVVTLLGQLAELASARGDNELERFDRRWAKQLAPELDAIRRAAIALGASPDRAGAPLDTSVLGQVIHRAGWALGTLGEWFDRRVTRERESKTAEASENEGTGRRE
jgi:hypothetical protein